MTTYSWPAGNAAASMTWRVKKAGVQFTSPLNGAVQAVDFMAERWLASVTLPAMREVDSGAVRALLELLAGGVNRVNLPFQPRPVILGTMRGTPTLAAAAAFGAMALTISTTPGATVLAGDMLFVGGQMVRCAADCIANGSGVLVVPITTHIRAAIAAGTAVVWNRPTALFCMPAVEFGAANSPRFMDSTSFELSEVW